MIISASTMVEKVSHAIQREVISYVDCEFSEAELVQRATHAAIAAVFDLGRAAMTASSAPSAMGNCPVCGYPGPTGTGGQPCAVAQPNVRIVGCILQSGAPSAFVQTIKKMLDTEIGHFNFEEFTPRLVAAVLDNLDREAMAAAILEMNGLKWDTAPAVRKAMCKDWTDAAIAAARAKAIGA